MPTITKGRVQIRQLYRSLSDAPQLSVPTNF